MKNIYTIIFVLVGMATILFSCKEDESKTNFIPGISFLDSYFEIPKGGEMVLTIAIDKPFEIDTKINVEISGGTLGVDYILENENEITIKAGERTAIFKVSIPSDITESKILTATIQDIPAGYNGGRFPSIKLKSILEPIYAFSFNNANLFMYGSSVAVEAGLYNTNGFTVKQNTDLRIQIAADESSTAILGKHYRFREDKNHVEIKAGSFSGFIIVESLLFEEGKNTIVLKSDEPNNYFNGNVPFTTIILPESIDKGLIGSWQGLKWTSPVEDYGPSWGIDPSQIEQMANSISSSDVITFNNDKTMTVDIKGPLNAFFRNCNWEIDGTERIVIGTEGIRPVWADAAICKLSVINYSFLNEQEQLQPGNMKLYITNDPEHGDMLNIHVSEGDYNYEYSPIPFLWGYEPLKYTFVRKQESADEQK